MIDREGGIGVEMIECWTFCCRLLWTAADMLPVLFSQTNVSYQGSLLNKSSLHMISETCSTSSNV